MPLKKNTKPVEKKDVVKPVQGIQRVFERYEVEVKVGSGTFGTVHKARDKKTL